MRCLMCLIEKTHSRVKLLPSVSAAQRLYGTTRSKTEAESEMEKLRTEVSQLTRRLDQANTVIRQLMRLVDKEKHQTEVEEMQRHFEGGGGLFLTENNADLEKALQTPGARIVLLENHHYTISKSFALRISRTSISITGNNATIEGCLRLSHNATLDACDVTFLFPKKYTPEAEDYSKRHNRTPFPCIEATISSQVRLHNCNLVGGRDGLYLGLNSKAELDNVRIENCARGLYEGVGCVTVFSRCTLAGNIFHIVLLGAGKRERVQRLLKEKSKGDRHVDVQFIETSTFGNIRTRADIGLDHDPISDIYSDLFYNGEPIQLPADLATCALSDPIY